MAPKKPMDHTVKTRNNNTGFRSQKEQEWWEWAFKERTVILERPANYEDMDVDAFPQSAAFNSRAGWKAYFGTAGNRANLNICTEFCASLLPVDVINEPYSFEARVRGITVALNPTTLGTVMGIDPLPDFEIPYGTGGETIPPTADDLYTYLTGRVGVPWPIVTKDGERCRGGVEKSKILRDKQMFWLVVANCIMPTTHNASVFCNHARVMHAIETRRRICLVRFFIQQIVSSTHTSHQKETIKFGVLITRLCIAAGVQHRPTDVRAKPKDTIDKRTQNKSLGQYKGKAVGGPSATGDDTPSALNPGGEHVEEPEQGEAMPAARKKKKRAAQGNVDAPVDMEALMEQMQLMNATIQSQYTTLYERQELILTRQQEYEARNASWQQSYQEAHQTDMGYLRGQLGVLDGRLNTLEGRVQTVQDDFGVFRDDWMSHNQSPPPED